MSLSNIDTKLEAYNLIHDPTRLFSLLYSKYGDIEEDYFILSINQFVFNKSTHMNVFYKESKILKDKGEYMHRYYHKKESKKRIPKLNEYYKNYHIFFCKPTFVNFVFSNILKNYEDKKAEIFYKNNYEDSNIKNDENEKSEKCESSSLSSLDNITFNKIIFDDRNKRIIDNDLDSKNITITLTLDSLKFNYNNDKNSDNKNLLTKTDDINDKENSFINSIKNIVFYQENKKKNIKKYKILKEKNESNKNQSQNNISKKEITKNYKHSINNLGNICKKINESIKNKNIKNQKNVEKSINNKDYNRISKDNKDNINNSKLLYKLNIKNSLYSLSKKNIINENKKMSNFKNNNNNIINNTNNIFLSPQTSKHYFTNITSRISEFNKYKPMNIKSSKRNKSYRINNNKKNHIHQTPLITNNNINNKKQNYTYYPYSNQLLEYNLKNLKNISTNKKNKNQNNNLYNKINSHNSIKLNPSQIIKYNQFLMMNNNKNIKSNKNNNKTFDLNMIEAHKNIKMLSNAKNILYNIKRMNSSNQSPIGIEYNGTGSKFNLFKGGISSPHMNSVNKQKSNRHFNNLKMYNKMSMNHTSNFNEYKKFMISNSLENNQISSLSPKDISSNITINNDKKSNVEFSKLSFNKINNNIKNQSQIGNGINMNINNKTKIPIKNSKNSISYSNSNYNINFNNLIFYGTNTPTNLIDDIKYNIINNNNNNNNKNNKNLKNINTNFYMMNFNNIYNNSRNKIKFSTNNSSSQNKIKTHTNSQSKNIKKNEMEKNNTNIKKNKINGNEKRIPFTINRQLIGKVKKNLGNIMVKAKGNKLKIENINYNYKTNNSLKKRSNKSFNISDNEKNAENIYDKIEKRKYSLINLRGIYGN